MISCARNLLITLTLFIAALFIQAQSVSRSAQTSIPDLDAARRLAPVGLTLEVLSTPFPQVIGKDQQNTIRWRGIYSQFLNHQISGYGGPISLLVGLGENMEITGITILQHLETPSFFQGLLSPWFLQQFAGKTIRNSLIPFQDIDGLTHATVSVEAFCETVRCCLSCANRSALPVSGSEGQKFHVFPVICLFLAFLSVLFRTRLPPLLSLFMVIIPLGILSQQFLSLSTVKTLAYGVQDFRVINTALFLYFSGTLLLALIRPWGYCQGLCPTGMLQEVFLWLARNSPGDSPPKASLLGRTLLWSALFASIFVPAFPLERVEVFSALWNFDLSFPGLTLIFAFLVGSAIAPRWYCHNLCPLNPAFSDLEYLKNSFRGRHHDSGIHPSE